MSIISYALSRVGRIMGNGPPNPHSHSSLPRRLTSEAGRLGWREAVLHTLRGDDPLLQYMADERAADWRFLLPKPPNGRILCVGGALSAVPLVLAGRCQQVVVECSPAEAEFLLLRAHEEGLSNVEATLSLPGSFKRSLLHGAEEFDLVAFLRPRPSLRVPPARRGDLLSAEIALQVKPGGHLYVEIDRPAVVVPPALVQRRLRQLGFNEIEHFWPKPTFADCEMLLPLGDRRLQHYYLSHVFFAMSWPRRVLRPILNVLVWAGLFELTLPGYMVLARRESREHP